MASRFHWDCGLPKAAAFKVAGKFFLASGQCGRASGLDSQTVTIFEVGDDQDEPLGLSRSAEYFVEMNQLDLEEGAARGLRRYPTDLDSWIARAEVASATGDEEAAAGALKLKIPRIRSRGLPRLPLDRRVGLAVLFARNKHGDLARDQTRACIEQLSEAELR